MNSSLTPQASGGGISITLGGLSVAVIGASMTAASIATVLLAAGVIVALIRLAEGSKD